MLSPSLRRQAMLQRLQTPLLGVERLESRNMMSADLAFPPETDPPTLAVGPLTSFSTDSSVKLIGPVHENDELVELLASSRRSASPSDRLLPDSRACERLLQPDDVDRVLETW